MAIKRIGISRDLIIHPGETIADVLEDRGISQVELAVSTGVSPAYVSKVIAGKKDISAKFAFALEYALGVSKTFWLNLQANYDAELLEYNEPDTITDEERTARESLNEIVSFLKHRELMPLREQIDPSILSLRRALRVSNLVNLKEFVPVGAFRMDSTASVDPFVLGAWIRLCRISGESRHVSGCFVPAKVKQLIAELKRVMIDPGADAPEDLQTIFAGYGIDFGVVRSFKGAPVQGYVAPKGDGSYQMILTVRDTHADIFWQSLFHELGHIVNGDVTRNSGFVDDGSDTAKEAAADRFARDNLLPKVDYQIFIDDKHFEFVSIER